MNKKYRPPYLLYIITVSIGMPLGEAFVIFGKSKSLNDFHANYFHWIKCDWLLMQIIFLIFASIFYLVMGYLDKRIMTKTNDV